MEASTPVFEDLLIYIGYLVYLLAAVYMAKTGHVKLGLLFIGAFILQTQVGYVVSNVEYDSENQSICWSSGRSYYDCLPLMHRVSIHAGQIGSVILGLAIFLSAKKLNE